MGLLISAELLLNPVLNFIVKPKLTENVNDRNYHLRIEKLSYSLFTNSLSAENIFYTWNDSSLSSIDSSAILIRKASAKGISLFGLIFSSRLNVLELELFKPEYKIFSLNESEGTRNKSGKKRNDSLSIIYKSLYRSIPDRIKPFKINKVEIIDAGFIKTGKEKNIKPFSIKSFNAGIKDLSIKSLEKTDSLTLMFCEDINISSGKISFSDSKEKYNGSIKSINFSSADSILILNSFSFIPILPDSEFFNGDKYRQDRWKVYISQLKCDGIDLSKFIWDNFIEVQNIRLDAQFLDILTNMRLNISPDFDPKMPNEIISEMSLDLNIRKVTLNIDSIVVRESWPYSRQPSRLPFTKVRGTLQNISGLKEYQTRESPAVINASARIAGAGLLTINMKVPLLAEGTDFSYSGFLGTMETDPLNDHLIISDLVEVTSGKIDSVIFKVQSKNGIVSANVVPFYKDLTIRSINESTMKGGGLMPSIATFIGNVFKIRNANSAETGTETGRIIYVQKKTDVFLDVVWVPLKTALGRVVGF
ncbi:MAG: hypothetical protein ACM339_06525 [Ignavibacteria bacterium]